MRKLFVCFVLALVACTGGKHYTSIDGGDDVDSTMNADDAGADASSDAQEPPAAFALTFGASGDDGLSDLYAVSDGIIVKGSMSGAGMLGTFALPARAFVIAKLDSNGTPIWAKSYGIGDGVVVVGAGSAVDAAGDIFVTGWFYDTANFGGSDLVAAGTYDMFIAKYSGADGSHLWSVAYGGAAEDRGYAVCADPAGDLYVGGLFNGTASVGGANMISAGGTDAFLAKYRGSDGAYLWGLRAGGTSNDSVSGLDCDSSKVVASGGFAGTANFGGADFTSAGSSDFILAAYNATNGNHLWSVAHGGSGIDAVASVELVPNGLYVAGTFSTTTNLGGATIVSQGLVDMFVAKYDASTGSYVWGKAYGDTGSDYASGLIAVGSELMVTGSFPTKINFGGSDLNSAGSDDVFVATITQATGSYVDAWRFGGTSGDKGAALVDFGGDPVVGGRFFGTVYFGSTEAVSNGGWDAFVYKRKAP